MKPAEDTGKGRAVLESVAIGAISLGTVLAWMYLEVRTFRVQPPFEDAAMLYRYAVQLAHGYGIAWNPGESPSVTDGATDLGFVLLLAPLIKLGMAPASAGVAINLVAVFLQGTLLGAANVLLWGRHFVLTVLLAVLIASGPVNRYVSGGFSPPVLGLLLSSVVVSVLLAYKPSDTSAMHRRLWLVVSGLLIGLAGWWRPEGFAIAIMLLAVTFAFLYGTHAIRISDFLWIMFPASTALVSWMLFRILYIGQLLPTSAVMKVDVGFHWGNGPGSALFIVGALLPLLSIAAVFALFTRSSRFWIILVLLIASSAIWVTVSPTMNWWNRMQWPLVPAIAVLTTLWIVNTATISGGPKIPDNLFKNWAAIGMAAACIAAVHGSRSGGYFAAPFHTAVAASLREIDTSGVRLATTEAGLIPLTIRGHVLDTFGHNNRNIAESSGASLEVTLKEFQPNIIILHGMTPPGLDQTGCEIAPFSPAWKNMIVTLYRFADANGLDLLRSTATGLCDTWTVFVRQDVSDSVRSSLLAYTMVGEELIKK